MPALLDVFSVGCLACHGGDIFTVGGLQCQGLPQCTMPCEGLFKRVADAKSLLQKLTLLAEGLSPSVYHSREQKPTSKLIRTHA